MTDILENIISYKKGNRDDILYVLEKIDPLLKKYAFKLDYEDAYFDLQLFVIESIYKIDINSILNTSDGALINYFNKSIYYEYIKLSKKKSEQNLREIYNEEENAYIESNLSVFDDYSELTIDSMVKDLTNKEQFVIKSIFYNGLSVEETARRLKQSKWNVYKLRDSALRKLKYKI